VKKNYWLVATSLLLSFFIYLIYRTDKTVINQIFISLLSFDKFVDLRQCISGRMPLNEQVIYSLPEGLWVFCITLTSKFLFVKVGTREIDLIIVPLVFSIGLELFQLFHLTNGRFDFWDIGFSLLFWVVGNYLIFYRSPKQNIVSPFTTRSVICFFSYLIVYFAHVWK
jgi:hypothetical protein